MALKNPSGPKNERSMDRYFYYVTSSVNNSVALVLSFENGLVSEAINKSIIYFI